MSEVVHISPVKGGVIPVTAGREDLGGQIPLVKERLGMEQPPLGDIPM